jgi:UV DNA damage repair endonuclease
MANRLKNKLAAAEISSEASRAGLGLDAARALELQAMGVSRTLARAGYSKISEQQQRLGMLGSIYETDVTDLQTELEAEQFQGLASQRRKRLTSQEGATFSGRAGTSQVSLGQSAAGAI